MTGNEPAPYRCPLAPSQREVRAIHQVVDSSDGGAVVATFRNVHLANKQAELSPAYEVRSYVINMRD